MSTNKMIALDVGGSSIKSGLVQSSRVSQLRTTPIDSAANAETIISTFADVIHSYGEKPAGIAFGFPGPCDYEEGICYIYTKKYDALYNLNIRKALLEKLKFNVPITFRNDAECAIVGEAIYGAGKTYSKLIGITLGTGFGSAFVINGEPQTSGKGVPDNGWVYDELWQGEKADDVFTIRGLKARFAKLGFKGNPKEAAEAARANPDIKKLFKTWGSEMGQFLDSYVQAFKPDAVLVLGGLAGAFDLFGRAFLDQIDVPAFTSQLNGKAALLGASDKLKKQFTLES